MSLQRIGLDLSTTLAVLAHAAALTASGWLCTQADQRQLFLALQAILILLPDAFWQTLNLGGHFLGAACLLFLAVRNGRALWACGIMTVLVGSASHLLKSWFEVPRPATLLQDRDLLHTIGETLQANAMPSGHALSIAAVVGALCAMLAVERCRVRAWIEAAPGRQDRAAPELQDKAAPGRQDKAAPGLQDKAAAGRKGNTAAGHKGSVAAGGAGKGIEQEGGDGEAFEDLRLLDRPWMLPVTGLIMLGVGLARVASGAHWPADVLVGTGLGLALGFVCGVLAVAIAERTGMTAQHARLVVRLEHLAAALLAFALLSVPLPPSISQAASLGLGMVLAADSLAALLTVRHDGISRH